MENLEQLRERLFDLELKYMHQARYIEQLSDVIAAQQRSIDELIAGVRKLREQLLHGDDGAIKDERPPHY